MSIRVALHHVTCYHYDELTSLGPQVIRLRPAPHCRTPILSYSLKVEPSEHFLNWQQDPFGNYLARFLFNAPAPEFRVEVDLIAEMTVIDPFDFFVEESVQKFPFDYENWLTAELRPFLRHVDTGPVFDRYLASIDRTPRNIIDFLVEINQRVQRDINYMIRMEPGVQTPEQTLEQASGSCRDSAWLLVQLLRRLGLAARFVSGYLIQLTPDLKPLDGPEGPTNDFTDLHAWTEVYLPGAGWIGMDPTSGLMAGEGHIPLACTPDPNSAAPVSGTAGRAATEFDFTMTLDRIQEDPRVTKPYTEEQWQRICAVGSQVDEQLTDGDVRLTMGGEPTFVSIDDMEGAEWNIAAVGPTKERLATQLIHRLKDRFGRHALLHIGQGKWYPGESLPRWALTCMWRTDGEPIWQNPALYASRESDYGATFEDSQKFAAGIAERLGVDREYVIPAYEDAMHYLHKEQRLPVNVTPGDSRLKDAEERARLAKVFDRGLDVPAGTVLPLRRQWWQARASWVSGPWPVRPERMFLLPGDSPMGLRLPLDALPYAPESESPSIHEVDPMVPRSDLPSPDELRQQLSVRLRTAEGEDVQSGHSTATNEQHLEGNSAVRSPDPSRIVRTAMCIEPRDGRLYVFMPPTESLDEYLELLAAIEDTAGDLNMPVILEGYLPPPDHRLQHIKVTPDPGVIEVNVHPAESWTELVDIVTGVYDEARLCRLGTEKFMIDGRHSGTGGGNHVVLGGKTPADSPFLRRPDLLKSMLGYWNNHPSLTYMFSGLFIGPTSQAPRVDEGRREALYELELAFKQVPPRGESCPPWLVDRIFRNLLVDLTGNTHRAEFCIDKLYSPDQSTGRLGLLELRGFEMPPHSRMSLTQQLLLRALVARFWNEPYQLPLVHWGTNLHDRFMLPYFIWNDFLDIIRELREYGLAIDAEWFQSHFEFRFPLIGSVNQHGIALELRTAIEPWYVLGEEPAAGGTARYVDSSVERLQVHVTGLTDSRYIVTCNGQRIPLHGTGVVGESVAGVRYRAWQPPSCLHPTIGVDTPLVFDIVDTWQMRSLGGCRYHVSHPGGRHHETMPVNSFEAEARRGSRFETIGHTGGPWTQLPATPMNQQSPLTLDLRRC